jgi:WD40 repeat protein
MQYARTFLVLTLAGTAFSQEKPSLKEPLPAGAVRRLGTSAFRLDGKVHDISPDGKWLACESERESALILMEVATGRTIRRAAFDEFDEQSVSCMSVRFTSDSEYLRILANRTIQTWQRDPWQLVDRIELPAEAIDQFPVELASAEIWIGRRGMEESDPLEAFDVHSGNSRFRFQQTYCLDASMELAAYWKQPAKDKEKAPDTGSPIEVLNLKTGRQVAQIHTDVAEVYRLALSNDGKQLAVTGGWGAEVWDLGTGKLNRAWPGHRETQTAFTPDGRTLIAVSDEVIRSWDIATGKRNPPIWSKRPRGQGAWKIVMPAKDNRILGIRSRAGTVELCDLATGKLLNPVEGHPGDVESLTFLPGTHQLLSASAYCPIIRWDARSGKLLGTAPESRDGSPLPVWTHAGSSPLISNTGRFALIPVHYPQLGEWPTGVGQSLWDLENQECLEYAFLGGVNSEVRARAFSRDDRLLAFVEMSAEASAQQCFVRLLDLRSGKAWPRLRLGLDCNAVAFSPSAERVAAIVPGDVLNAPPSLIVWDIKARKRVAIELTLIGYPHDLTFLSERQLLVTGTRVDKEEEIATQVLDPLTGKAVPWPEEGLGVPDQFFLRPILSPSGRMIAIVTAKGLSLYEVASGSVRHRFTPESPISAMAFSDDGNLLATGHRDTTILLWDLDRVAEKSSDLDSQAIWKRLSQPDAAKAWAAMRQWIDRPAEAVAFIREQVKPVAQRAALDAAEVKQLIAALDASKFADREVATKTLSEAGPAIIDAIRAARKKPASEEARKRLEAIYDRITAPEDLTPWLAQLRAIEVLERIGAPQAVEHLKALAAGDDSPPTAAAKQALDRLNAKVAGKK